MSGGSFNYLCYKEPVNLFHHIEDLEDVERYLLRNGYYDVAHDVRRQIEYLESARNRIEVLHEQLSPVLKAVEWYVSGDYGEDSLKRAVEKYRRGDESDE